MFQCPLSLGRCVHSLQSAVCLLETFITTSLPAQIPRESFRQALELAVPFNTLIAAVARDTEWLTTTLQQCVGSLTDDGVAVGRRVPFTLHRVAT